MVSIKSAHIENLFHICYFGTMALHLAIDGYNLTGVMTMPGQIATDLEGTREELIKRLQAYKRLKGHRITIVFDGKRSGSFSRARMNQGGIEIVFSKDGEEADQILKEMAKKERHGITIVTSDRAIASFAEAHGSVTIPSDEFDAICAMAIYSDMKGVIDEDEEEDTSTKKSGNPRKASKQERKRLQRIKKL
ncbi:MAG: NYN domain-containing protein [Deltaproteobacteria bacterium]|nr:NYN domain-containing protein [Deltaproteobacteria bacterium]